MNKSGNTPILQHRNTYPSIGRLTAFCLLVYTSSHVEGACAARVQQQQKKKSTMQHNLVVDQSRAVISQMAQPQASQMAAPKVRSDRYERMMQIVGRSMDQRFQSKKRLSLADQNRVQLIQKSVKGVAKLRNKQIANDRLVAHQLDHAHSQEDIKRAQQEYSDLAVAARIVQRDLRAQTRKNHEDNLIAQEDRERAQQEYDDLGVAAGIVDRDRRAQVRKNREDNLIAQEDRERARQEYDDLAAAAHIVENDRRAQEAQLEEYRAREQEDVAREEQTYEDLAYAIFFAEQDLAVEGLRVEQGNQAAAPAGANENVQVPHPGGQNLIHANSEDLQACVVCEEVAVDSITPCCRQKHICDTCWVAWLVNSNSCPFCRQILRADR